MELEHAARPDRHGLSRGELLAVVERALAREECRRSRLAEPIGEAQYELREWRTGRRAFHVHRVLHGAERARRNARDAAAAAHGFRSLSRDPADVAGPFASRDRDEPRRVER